MCLCIFCLLFFKDFFQCVFVCFAFYIQSFHMTEYFSPERALSVRVYVCVCVCVCLSVCLSVTTFYLNIIWPILMEFEPHDFIKNRR